MLNTTIYQFKVSLKDAPLPIWRRIEISSLVNFEDLHEAIQQFMGWYNCHLWQFEKGDYCLVDSQETLSEYGDELAANVLLAEFFKKPKDKITYLYDMGDGWEHEVVLEKVLTSEAGIRYPRCTKGKGACPPEDCGGVWGYAELLETLKDPKNPDYEDMCEWLDIENGEEWDPTFFDIEEVNL